MVIHDAMYGYQMTTGICETKLQATHAFLTKLVMHHDGIHHSSYMYIFGALSLFAPKGGGVFTGILNDVS